MDEKESLPNQEDFNFVNNRLNSFLRDLKEIEEKEESGTGSYYRKVEALWKQFKQFHDEVIENFKNQFKHIPVHTYEAEYLEYKAGERLSQYMKTTTRNIADAMGISLTEDNIQRAPTTVLSQFQNQSSVQTVIQNMDNFIENITSLNIEQSTKTEIINLMKEFESEAKKDNPDSKTLREKFYNICKKSMDAGIIALKFANTLGILTTLLI